MHDSFCDQRHRQAILHRVQAISVALTPPREACLLVCIKAIDTRDIEQLDMTIYSALHFVCACLSLPFPLASMPK